MDAWHRAISFIRRVDVGTAETVLPFTWGRALINRRLNLVHDANYLLADRLDGASAQALIAEAERIQADFGHRRVNVDDEAAAIAFSSGFEAAGYAPERFVLMAHGRFGDRSMERPAVREVSWAELRPARERQRRAEPWATEQLLEQLLAKHELTARVIPTRYFGAVLDGQVVSSCELRVRSEEAQIETVETLAEYRNRGLSRAVISAALDAARDASFVFLVTDADDWPQRFYARLGFEPIGIESRFLRLIHA